MTAEVNFEPRSPGLRSGGRTRTRLRLYSKLSRFRQQMNNTSHLERTGDEVFE